jgi:hypothetical protein
MPLAYRAVVYRLYCKILPIQIGPEQNKTIDKEAIFGQALQKLLFGGGRYFSSMEGSMQKNTGLPNFSLQNYLTEWEG